MTMTVGVALFAIVFAAATADGQGSISGCVNDRSGGALPGVEVVASNAAGRQRAVTAASGCYVIEDVPLGTYTVTAALAGFVTGSMEGVEVASSERAVRVDFALCLGALGEIDWELPGRGGLTDAWKRAAVVAHVRIASTRQVRSDCPTRNVEHAATVIEMFKAGGHLSTTRTLHFEQEIWASERTPYAVGQQMVVFLSETPSGLKRVAGPYYVFCLNGNTVTNFGSPVRTESTTTGALLSELRALTGRR